MDNKQDQDGVDLRMKVALDTRRKEILDTIGSAWYKYCTKMHLKGHETPDIPYELPTIEGFLDSLASSNT